MEKKFKGFTRKSFEVLAKHHLAKYTLLEGAVRSGKSYLADFVAINIAIPRMPPCNILISGYTADSVKQNIISEWEEKLNNTFKEHRDSKGTYYTVSTKGLHNKRFYIRGGGKGGDDKSIRGHEYGFWYADEINMHTPEFIELARTRMSVDGANSIWTCNPDSPTNHVKTNFIDLKNEPHMRGVFQNFKFTMYDNLSLPESYRHELASTFHGVFYERNVLGKWVAAEGHIYTMLTDDNITDYIPLNPRKVYITADYGSSNSTVFQKVYEEDGVLYIVDEWEHDGRKGFVYSVKDGVSVKEPVMKAKTPTDYVDHLRDFIGRDFTRLDGIFCDPSAKHFILEGKKAGIPKWKETDNDVISGIQILQDKFMKREVMIHRACRQSYMQLIGYLWDKNAQEKGEDKPIKVNDHFPDALRYLTSTLAQLKPIYAKGMGKSRFASKLVENYKSTVNRNKTSRLTKR